MKREYRCLTATAAVMISLSVLGAGHKQIFPVGVSKEEQSLEKPSAREFFAMNTIITMEVYDSNKEEILDEAVRLIGKLDGLWSVTDKNSEVYAMNHHQGLPVRISEETGELARFSLHMARETKGAFNPAIYSLMNAWGFTTGEYRIPEDEELKELLSHSHYHEVKLDEGTITLPEQMEIDFGAVGKGYAGDLAVQALKSHGVRSAILNLGGNVALIGRNPDKNLWKVGIRSPYGEGTMGTLEAEDCHIITSGGYERYFTGEDGTVYWHILDPENGKPADSGIISATIVGREGRMCDALSTAVFVMGRDQTEEYWRTHEGFEMILVTDDNEIYITEKLEGYFRLNETSRGIPVFVIHRES